MSRGVEIKYGDISPDAKENFEAQANDKAYFVTMDEFQKNNISFPPYENPCDQYSVLLDGVSIPIPENPNNANMGLWSQEISDENGDFPYPIILTLTSSKNYTIPGLKFHFDKNNDVFATRMAIKWYRVADGSEQLINSAEFSPDASTYFCAQTVEIFNKAVITFYSINMPRNRLKLTSIDYGQGYYFIKDDLKSIKIVQGINPISSEISINSTDFTLASKNSSDYAFQKNQSISTYFNGNLISTTFITSAKRTNKEIISIQSEDYIGLMDGVPFRGGIYFNALARDVLRDIFKTAKVPYNIDSSFTSNVMFVSGYIPYTTCREALMQVAFAIQAVVDTSYSDVVRVYPLSNNVKTKIPLSRIMQGQKIENENRVTSVELISHRYTKTQEEIEVYSANDDGYGDGIFIRFNEPLHDLTLTGGGSIVESGANYAIINSVAGSILKGKKYKHTEEKKEKKNPNVLANESEKVVSITGATLVSPSIVDRVLESCYNWLVKGRKTSMKIVEKQSDISIAPGDIIVAETQYMGDIEGMVISQSFNLNGNIIIKDTVMK